jgi:hypothetical protein
VAAQKVRVLTLICRKTEINPDYCHNDLCTDETDYVNLLSFGGDGDLNEIVATVPDIFRFIWADIISKQSGIYSGQWLRRPSNFPTHVEICLHVQLGAEIWPCTSPYNQNLTRTISLLSNLPRSFPFIGFQVNVYSSMLLFLIWRYTTYTVLTSLNELRVELYTCGTLTHRQPKVIALGICL